MKQRVINENPEWEFWLPDMIADWDAPSHWERERLASMRQHLNAGDVLYDIGTELAWMSAVYGSFCGYENMVLVEPSTEFWPDIRKTWQANSFPGPIACYPAFAGAEVKGEPDPQVWPDCADGEEAGHWAYRTLVHHSEQVPTVTVDYICENTRMPDALSIDVEGAELLVVQGALHTLLQVRPLVWISIHPDLMMRDFEHDDKALHAFMDGICDYEGELIHTDHEEHWLFTPTEGRP